ncbi:MAG: ribose 5-phosphate isomerase B [Ruminococcaceae bacterium]|nr:ribose 5-phosphate isomerase B [Oscillospiraceae bacterium]
MTIAMAADHGGYELKNVLLDYLAEKGHAIINLGTDTAESVDYPDYAKACCDEVVSKRADFGILVCGTGVGISIAANKIDGIRCGLCPSKEIAALVKQHNNANVIALGGRFTSDDEAKKIVDAYMSAEFEGGRHQNRVDKIMALEK